MKYEFLYAPTGAQLNAQYAIIGARIDYVYVICLITRYPCDIDMMYDLFIAQPL